ncbi:PREDICTED: kelch-like protein 42 [Corvus brachyrhynchos]|uniref:kelch-like protein 42 n=1 Tax=Corvus brachyrhynchos TaxID=85066 RepID=UPI0008164269|nr:PREDICTED: kelch-like protein 42 [Corvus brachyrhynchos]
MSPLARDAAVHLWWKEEEEEGEGEAGDGAGAGEEVVQIRLGDKCYPVCKRKLIEQSDYFRALYRSGMREAGQGQEEQLLRGGLSALGLELVLDFINTSCLARLEQEEGGEEEPPLLEELITSQEISAAHCYNPCLNEWSQLASMNQKRSNFKLLAVSGKLYAIGGQSLSNVECYNPENDWWNFVASMPNPLAEFSACECKGKIYVIGGYTARGRNMSILQYCPTSDSWTNLELCDVHVRKQQMLSVEETIYLVGGCILDLGPNQRSSPSEDVLTVQSYNIATKEWLYLNENSSKSGLNLTCTLHNDGVYILSRNITLSSSLEQRLFLKYNIFTDTWESLGRFPAFGQNILICSMYLPDGREV